MKICITISMTVAALAFFCFGNCKKIFVCSFGSLELYHRRTSISTRTLRRLDNCNFRFFLSSHLHSSPRNKDIFGSWKRNEEVGSEIEAAFRDARDALAAATSKPKGIKVEKGSFGKGIEQRDDLNGYANAEYEVTFNDADDFFGEYGKDFSGKSSSQLYKEVEENNKLQAMENARRLAELKEKKKKLEDKWAAALAAAESKKKENERNKIRDAAKEMRRKAEEMSAKVLVVTEAKRKDAADKRALARAAAEAKKKEEEARAAAEAREREKDAQAAAGARQREKAARAAFEAKKREETARVAAEAKEREKAARAAAEAKKKKEDARAAAEARDAEERRTALKREQEEKRSKELAAIKAKKLSEREKLFANLFQGPRKKPVTAPRGIPTISNWKQNRYGGVSGAISGSKMYAEGEKISTSPLTTVPNANGGVVVTTTSGSRYFLALVEDTKEKNEIVIPSKRTAVEKKSIGLSDSRKKDEGKLQTSSEKSKIFGLIGNGLNLQRKFSVAPRGVPTLSNWKVNRNGRVTGIISGSDTRKDGARITTSPLTTEPDMGGGVVVTTTSGSRYYLSILKEPKATIPIGLKRNAGIGVLKSKEKEKDTSPGNSKLLGLFEKEEITPRVVPALSDWRLNRNGGVTGVISGSDTRRDGATVTTSPLTTVPDIDGFVEVTTFSGLRYFLVGSQIEGAAKGSNNKVQSRKPQSVDMLRQKADPIASRSKGKKSEQKKVAGKEEKKVMKRKIEKRKVRNTPNSLERAAGDIKQIDNPVRTQSTEKVQDEEKESATFQVEKIGLETNRRKDNRFKLVEKTREQNQWEGEFEKQQDIESLGQQNDMKGDGSLSESVVKDTELSAFWDGKEIVKKEREAIEKKKLDVAARAKLATESAKQLAEARRAAALTIAEQKLMMEKEWANSLVANSASKQKSNVNNNPFDTTTFEGNESVVEARAGSWLTLKESQDLVQRVSDGCLFLDLKLMELGDFEEIEAELIKQEDIRQKLSTSEILKQKSQEREAAEIVIQRVSESVTFLELKCQELTSDEQNYGTIHQDDDSGTDDVVESYSSEKYSQVDVSDKVHDLETDSEQQKVRAAEKKKMEYEEKWRAALAAAEKGNAGSPGDRTIDPLYGEATNTKLIDRVENTAKTKQEQQADMWAAALAAADKTKRDS